MAEPSTKAGRASAAPNAPRDPSPSGSVRADAPPAPRSAEESRSAEDSRNAEEQQGRTPFAQLDLSGYSSLARKIIELARRYALTGRGSGFASSRSLLVSMLYLGKSESRPSSVSWLWHSLRPHHEALERSAAAYYPELSGLSLNKRPGSVPQAEADDMTADLAGIFADAHRMAQQSRETVVSGRHLVGSLILPRGGEPTNAEKMLIEAGVDLSRLRLEFVGALQRWNQGDDIRAWRDVLRASEGRADRLLAGYTSDAVAGDDLIGITREVEAMASLAAAWTIEPPLSIGLFGEWGSGKSFFMQKMKERVRHIARAARESGKGQKDFGYYKNIVQVEFNAWHYVEGNLWASLVEHIFQNLKVIDKDDEEDRHLRDRQERIFAELRAQVTHKDKALEEQEQLAAQQTADEARAKDLERQQREADAKAEAARREVTAKAEEKRTVSARDVVKEVYESNEVRAALKPALTKLGVDDQALATAAEVRASLREATTSWNVLREGWRALAGAPRPWMLLLIVLSVPVVVAAIGWGASRTATGGFGQLANSLAGAISTILGLAAAAVVAWKKYRPLLDPILAAARAVRAKREELERTVEAARQEQTAQVAKLEQEAEAKRTEAAEAAVQAQQKRLQADRAAEKAGEAQKRIEEIRSQLDALRPERMIASFISDRASAEDYRKHLGVPALIQRDFQQLSRMFRRQRKVEDEEKDGLEDDGSPKRMPGLDAEGKPLPPRNDPTVINRIVLYVDDLDRCPPGKVVEVLRAIHLLLAFPLFVVVVAVDARWVRRSLKDQFKLLLASSDDAADNERATQDGRPREDTAEALRQASTDDYLEKIFQVAFWLRPLGDAGCHDLLMNLVPSTSPPGPNGDAQGGPGATNAEPGAIARDGGASPGPSSGLQAGSGGLGLRGGSGGLSPPPGLPTPPFHRPPPPRPAWTPVTAQPKTLQITEAEREYMLTLAPIIGRSPRAVKRFINCYRLAKAMLDPGTLESFAPGLPGSSESRATMFLLAAVSGAPEVATPLLDALERTSAGTPEDWLKELRQAPPAHPDWPRIETALESLISFPHFRGMNALKDAAQRVDRFAFTPTRARPDSPRREPAPTTTTAH